VIKPKIPKKTMTASLEFFKKTRYLKVLIFLSFASASVDSWELYLPMNALNKVFGSKTDL
jgi:hypothetical protein